MEAAAKHGFRVRFEYGVNGRIASVETIGKASTPGNPANVNAKLGVAPGAAVVERLMAKTLHHRKQLLLGSRLRQFFCDETDDSRQENS